MTVIELKAEVYDLLVQIERHDQQRLELQEKLKELNSKIREKE